ncbi:hypothetical protein [Acidianus brierleyi]|uniref:Uncharacterized protein n=1 Tax=Acidianus brierleyi TaxID=41673 RepID=A0A2U9IGV6_9CREN|nr:hypothetical protein [Acidianus brierleyi]AWR95273.1 hypothetical protein DFR85_12365 [Acidianus brierleyi]
MEGPYFIIGGIQYKGYSEKFSWNMEFYLKENEKPKLKIILDVDYKKTGLEKLLGRSSFKLAEHIVTAHFVPFFELYKDEDYDFETTLNEMYREENFANQIVSKIGEISEKIDNGIILIKGEKLKATLYVVDRNISNMKLILENRIILGDEVLKNLLLNRSKVTLIAYQVYLDEFFEKIIEKKESYYKQIS